MLTFEEPPTYLPRLVNVVFECLPPPIYIPTYLKAGIVLILSIWWETKLLNVSISENT